MLPSFQNETLEKNAKYNPQVFPNNCQGTIKISNLRNSQWSMIVNYNLK